MAYLTDLQPHVRGEIFEDYVRECLFDYGNYELLERTPRFTDRKDHFALSALRPDFKFRDRRTNREFYVEAKFRTLHPNNNTIWWSYRDQLDRYQSYAKECPTFLILGIGKKPGYPAMLGLIPMVKANYTGLFLKYIKAFEIPLNQPVPSKKLWAIV